MAEAPVPPAGLAGIATMPVARTGVADRRTPLLWLAGALFVLLVAPTAAWLWERWTISVWQHAHGLLIPPAVGWFVYQELSRHPKTAPAESSAWGFAFLVPALLLHALDAGMHTQLLAAVAIILALPGLSLLLLGTARTRAIAFPLAFTAFALPIPLAVTEPVHMALRQLATAAATTLVPLFGVPAISEGTTVFMASGNLLVIDACSGFSTLYAALAVACLTASAAPSMSRRILVLAAAVPLAIAANLLRVTFLALLVGWGQADLLRTVIHDLSGLATFALALPPILWLGGSRR